MDDIKERAAKVAREFYVGGAPNTEVVGRLADCIARFAVEEIAKELHAFGHTICPYMMHGDTRQTVNVRIEILNQLRARADELRGGSRSASLHCWTFR